MAIAVSAAVAFMLPAKAQAASEAEISGFNVEWHNLEGNAGISVENGEISSLTVLEGKAKVKGASVQVKKSGAVRIRCTVRNPELRQGPGSTIVSVMNGDRSFSFFLRDVNVESPIWIPEYEVVVLPEGDDASYSETVEYVRSRNLVSKLDRIEQAEEASFDEAFRTTRHMSAPIWLGISRDIRRFEISEELPDAISTVQTDKRVVPTLACSVFSEPEVSAAPLSYNYSFSRGVGAYANITRSLEDGVMPIYHSVTKDDDVIYHSRSFVTLEKSVLVEENVRGTHFMISDNYSGGRAWTPAQRKQLEEVLAGTSPAEEETVLVIHTTITNTAEVPRYAWMKLPYASFAGGAYEYDPETGCSTFGNGKVFCISMIDGKPATNEEMAVLLKAGESIEVDYYMPHRPISTDRALELGKKEYPELYSQCKAFWQKKLDSAARIHVPDQRLNDMIRAGLLHLDLITFGDREQGTLAPNVGVYSPIGTESAPIIQFYESVGLTDQARRCLQYFIDTQQEDGRIVNFFGYTIETGGALWSIGEYWRYTHDREWVESVMPQILKACRYIIGWRSANMKDELKGRGYGMLDGKVADPEDQFHQFMLNAYSYLGLKEVTEMLGDIGAEEHEEFEKVLAGWRDDILDSFKARLASSPVVPLSDGSWCPTCSPWAESMTARFFLHVAEKYRSHGTFMAPDALLGPIHLLFAEVVDPTSVGGQFVLKYYTDIFCQENTPFSQPYYGKHNVVQARLGMVKPFLNTYFQTVAPHFDHETGTFWEHYFKQSPHKTHEEAHFLMETRQMLYMERGDTLQMLKVIPRRWMKDGETVELDSVRSYFGPLSFKAVSSVAEGTISASIDCGDASRKPSTVTIRLPHPDGKKALSVNMGTYDPVTETVTISDFSGSATVTLTF